MNLFLTKDGVLKMGYYGLTTQADFYSIKEMKCDGVRSFAPEVFKGEYEMKSDVWSLGTALIELMGITPYSWCDDYGLPPINGYLRLPFDEDDITSSVLLDYLKKCSQKKEERWNVNELMNVSVMG